MWTILFFIFVATATYLIFNTLAFNGEDEDTPSLKRMDQRNKSIFIMLYFLVVFIISVVFFIIVR